MPEADPGLHIDQRPHAENARTAINTARRLAPTRGNDMGRGAVAFAGVAQAYAILHLAERVDRVHDRLDSILGLLEDRLP